MTKVIERPDYAAEIAEHEQAIAGAQTRQGEIQATIARLEQQPNSRAIEFEQLEKHLQSTQSNLEIAKEQAFNFFGTEHEAAALESQRRHETTIAKLEHELPLLREKIAR